jgi:hypothetical protein
MEVSQVLIPSNRGALQASAELCDMAIKSFKEEAKPKVIVKTEEPPVVPEPKKHYSEDILGKADDKSTAEPDKVAIEDAVKQTIKQIIGGNNG